MQRILDKYKSLVQELQLIDKLQQTKRLHLKKLIGSSQNFLLAAIFEQINRPILLILDNYETAAYAYDDLQNIMGQERVLFFPSSLRISFLTEEVRGVDSTNLLARSEVMTRLAQQEPVLVVSYPGALAHKVVPAESFRRNTLEIAVGQSLDVETISEFLAEYGFVRTDYVIEPGQFAIRGGIVDIFSFNSDTPYRIEFFGDEVESIRKFDIETQISYEHVEKIQILPDLQTKEDKQLRISFFEFLPKQTLLVFNDLSFFLEYIERNQGKKFEFEDRAGEIISIENANLQEIEKQIPEFELIELANLPLLAKGQTIEFQVSPQPSFNKNFRLLTQQLRELRDLGYQIYIFSSQQKQLMRLRDIFDSEEVGAKDIDFIPIAKPLYQGFIDHKLRLVLFTDHQIFGRYHRYQLKDQRLRRKKDNLFLKELQSLKPGDYVVHIDFGIGKFAGLTTLNNNGKKQEAVKIVYQGGDLVYVPIHSLHKISKYKSKDGQEPKLHKLGTSTWRNLKSKAKRKVKDIAKQLIALYAKRLQEKGFAFSADTYLQEELEASFMYEDTPDQAAATKAVKADMEKPIPMDRLVCGDVGFGKTEVAIRAAFKAVADNKQVAVLCPTTVLTLQHYKTFTERLKDFPVTIDYISRLKSPKQQKETLKRLAEGKIDIIIGTHRLLSKDVVFKDLGLLIIDEEQKFGVAAKERLRELRVNVDTLTLTATPIPRTLQFSLMGARDLSIINTPPPNRRPIITELHQFDKEIIQKAICYELSRNGQVFFVHNHVKTLPRIAEIITEVCPKARVAIAHGQMKPTELDKIMTDFINYEYDVLVTTTIIENGLDIPNANTIIINDAHKFGLSDLHQLRGRVGRSSRQAFCYLLAPPKTTLSQNARRRLETIEQFTELGSGFNIALMDLDIRGAGNLLGAEQSGFINEMGYETYRRILEEAVNELRNEEFKDIFKDQQHELDSQAKYVTSCQISTDLELHLPNSYVPNEAERLRLYHKLNHITTEQEIEAFKQELRDRFGPIPPIVNQLIDVVRLRWIAEKLGMEKIVLKNGQMICYFVSNKDSAFYDSKLFANILQFIASNKDLTLKEKHGKLLLKFPQVENISQALKQLRIMAKQVGIES